MHIHCVGLSHQTARLNLREQIYLSEEAIETVLAHQSETADANTSHMSELVILSTCNRVEFYAVSPDPEAENLTALIANWSGLPRREIDPYLFRYRDEQAIDHIFHVASGLDSLVLGEQQILGQVTHALELAQDKHSSGPVLIRLFQAAIHAGKRAHTETKISRDSVSVPSLAVKLAARNITALEKAQVVIVGAGEMAQLTIQALRKRGVEHIRLINRSLSRLTEFTELWGVQMDTLEHLEQVLSEADILITSTGAPQAILPRSLLVQTMQKRVDRPLVAIDIGVPRNIDPQVGSIPNVYLYDIDSLNQQVENSLAIREQEAPKVEAILEQEAAKFHEYLNTLDILPFISDLQHDAEVIRQTELQKTLRRLPDLTEAEVAHIDALTRALVKKLLSPPIKHLRAEAQRSSLDEYTPLLRELFQLGSHEDR